MASEDPTAMFADMKKKKKKPKVAFSEEPASADADPTYPPKEPINDPALGPITAHERIATSAAANSGAPEDAEADDLKNMFGDLKRKKKKKELVVEEPEPVPVAEEAADNLDFSDLKKPKKKKEVQLDLDDNAAPLDDFSDLKRKKKKKDIPMDLEGEAPPAEGADDFSDLKKKKKKVLAMEDFEKELGGSIAPAAKPKKAKKVAVEENEEGEEEEDGEYDEIDEVDEAELGENPFAAGGGGGGGRDGESAAWVKDDDKDYTYDELLSRFFRLLHAANPNLASSSGKRYTLAPPSIHRDGNKKSVFANIGDICKRMHREPQHVINFLLTEMGTTGSVDGSGRLVIKGKFQQKQVENILRRYIVEYVTCKTCKSPDTLLTKETRISFITCETCGSRQSVSAIKAGFTAQVGKRKKQQV